jgi:hypothetical protein
LGEEEEGRKRWSHPWLVFCMRFVNLNVQEEEEDQDGLWWKIWPNIKFKGKKT